MTKYESSALSIVVPPTFVIHLVNGAYFLNDNWDTGADLTVISLFTQMEVSL